MQPTGPIALIRACEATQIPAGNTVLLSAGTEAEIVQTLGGSYTIQTLGGLFRIAGKDADALGISGTDSAASAKAHADAGPVEPETVWSVLRTCYDPEIPVNIVDLGLVYDMALTPLAAGGTRAEVKMTLTAPGCGMGPAIAGDAQQKILDLPGIAEAEVQVVWDPPWNPARISPEGRAKLGLDE
jgi:probable FeS assembly SUF system protein SufT